MAVASKPRAVVEIELSGRVRSWAHRTSASITPLQRYGGGIVIQNSEANSQGATAE